MRYIDSGKRSLEQALASWLQAILTSEISEARCQSGFFTSEPLGLFAPTLQRLASSDGTTTFLIGANDQGTLKDDVMQLLQLLGLPRTNGRLGIVQYSNAFFHPKVYHFRRNDGSQCAYVGSANLTGQGISSLHIEAGILLDTRDGDPASVLDDIANAIEAWFGPPTREGMHVVTGNSVVDQLVTDGVLQLVPPPRPPTGSGGSGASGTMRTPPRLRSLVSLPVTTTAAPPAPPPPAPAPLPVVSTPGLISANKTGFPPEILFAPTATRPTSGAGALSGNALPSGAIGMIVRLTRDDTRVFGTGVGTANINLPVASMRSLRFGILGRGGYPDRPRAEFDLEARYLGRNNQTLVMPSGAETNVMIYGYLPGESGHQNRRMLLPADCRQLRDMIVAGGLPVPSDGHLAFIEWPTVILPDVRISFLDPQSQIGEQAQILFNAASASGQTLANNCCPLMPGVCPTW